MSVLGYLLAVLVGVSLGMLGGGGSILTTPILRYVFLLDQKSAIATSLAVVGAVSAIGFLSHWRRGNVRFRVAAIFGIPAAATAYVAGKLSHFIRGDVQFILFGIVALIAAVMMWRRSMRQARLPGIAEQPAVTSAHPALLALTGIAVGALTGTLGVGGGFLILPALVFAGGLAMHEAIGTSLFTITLTAFSGFAGQLTHENIDWRLLAAFVACAALGVIGGAWASKRVSAARLQQAFAVLVFCVAIYVMVRR